MRNQRKLILEQLDRKLEPFYEASEIQIPQRGWINTIRTALNMTLEQLGNKLGITKQGVRKLEENEASGAISIKSMKEIAQVLDMRLVYGFIPNQTSFEKLVEQKARQMATKIVLRTNQSMILENQGTQETHLKAAIEDLTQEIKREMRRSIWD